MRIKIKLKDYAIVIPSKQTAGSSGYDICSPFIYLIKAKTSIFIPTGVKLEIPSGYEAQVRSRSGLVKWHGIGLCGGIGTIDSDYRGEIGIILYNYSECHYKIAKGERVAQLVFNKIQNIKFVQVQELVSTIRNENGFGSTGV